MEANNLDFTMFSEFADGIDISTLEERSSPTNPKYFTTGVVKPELPEVEHDGVKYRRSVSLSITYLPVKAGQNKTLRTLSKEITAGKVTKEDLQKWIAELE